MQAKLKSQLMNAKVLPLIPVIGGGGGRNAQSGNELAIGSFDG